jgi:hypothetical protein
MKELHESVAPTAREMIIKESKGYRLRMEKWEALAPKGVYNIDLIQETLDIKGNIADTSTYNFQMTKSELNSLAYALTL